MGFHVCDAITDRPIKEGEKVIAYFMVDKRSSNPHVSISLYADRTERYQFASLPVTGTWDGYQVIPDDHDSLAVRSAIAACSVSAQSFIDLQKGLHANAVRRLGSSTEGESHHQFSMFVIKADTPKFLNSIKEVSKNVPFDAEKELVVATTLFARLNASLQALLNNKDDNAHSRLYGQYDKYRRAFFFEYEQDTMGDGLKVPFASKTMAPVMDSTFSSRFKDFMEGAGLFGFNAGDMHETALRQQLATGDARSLPADYREAFIGLHQTQFLIDAMLIMDIPLKPSTWVKGRRLDSRYVEFKTAVLFQEVQHLMDELTDNMEQKEVVKIDRALAPIKKHMAKVIKRRDAFEAEVRAFDADL